MPERRRWLIRQKCPAAPVGRRRDHRGYGAAVGSRTGGRGPDDRGRRAGAEEIADRTRLAADAAAMAASAAELRRGPGGGCRAHSWTVAWRALEPVLAADAELAALTDVILGKGQNSRSMSLRTYVLAAKLAQVALSAGRTARRHVGRPLHLRPVPRKRKPGDDPAGWGWTSSMRSRGWFGRRRHCPAASRSWPRWPWRSDWRMWSQPKPAVDSWTRCSSTRASAASTRTPWIW